MVADLHWGKAEIFQMAGIPVSSQILLEDLQRLREIIAVTGAERLLLLGDLLHGRQGLTAELQSTVTAWRKDLPVDIIFIRGNHDRNWECPADWQMQVMAESWDDGPFHFRHDPLAPEDGFTFCGHLHPVVMVGDRHDRLRLPCFWLQKHCGILPSFGSFTGGARIQPGRADHILAIAEGKIFALS